MLVRQDRTSPAPSAPAPSAGHAVVHGDAPCAAADRGNKSEHPNGWAVNGLLPALAGGVAERHSQAAGDLLRASEREMNAALALRQARAGLSALLEAIWPGPENQDGAADFARAGAFLAPPVLSAALDELEGRYHSARAVWEEARRHKEVAVGRFLRARAARMS